MAAPGGLAEGDVLAVIGVRVGAGAGVKQPPDGLAVAALHGRIEHLVEVRGIGRRLTAARHVRAESAIGAPYRVGIGATLEQQRGDVALTPARRDLERRQGALVALIER